ncbi:C-C motif chemokine 4 homolog, partial [Polypterus senegalus]|uniref:C-C motif chemokine 4 homolog n=1 Tax=Polypterus senegalus TaxID=55291 RepID=UPI0019643354
MLQSFILKICYFSRVCILIYCMYSNKPSKCCFSYVKKEILLKMVSNYEKTRSDCTKPGIVFITRKGILVCANPEQKWVKDSVDHLNAILKPYPEESSYLPHPRPPPPPPPTTTTTT